MKKFVFPATLSLALAVMLSLYVAAQQPRSAEKQVNPQPGASMMSMDKMMEQCRQHCESTAKSVDALMKTVADAKQSNDPAKMRAALDAVEKPLGEMKNHMNMCMSMMKMMGDMHMRGQSDQKNPPTK